MGCAGLGGLCAFSAAISLVFSLLALIVVLPLPVGPWPERLAIVPMVAAMVFMAAFLLGFRDFSRQALAVASVRKQLRARQEMSDEQFLAHFSTTDRELVLQIRQALGAMFEVPESSIYPTDNLQTDLRADVLTPALHFFVVQYVAELRGAPKGPFYFDGDALCGLDRFAAEVQRALDRMADSMDSEEEPPLGGK